MRYAVGIDLHGTLMEDREYILPELVEPLKSAILGAKRVSRLYVCTGNDLTFVKRKISPDILGLFDGLVLEMGGVLSRGDDEEVLVDAATIGRIKSLEAKLKAYADTWAYKLDRRLTAIAIFTKYGFSPADYRPVVEERVKDLGFDDLVYVTHSSVAVDIVPRGFSKMTGLKAVAGGLETVGVADSMNDLQMHMGADYSFCPSNVAPQLKHALIKAGRKVENLGDAVRLERGVTYVAEKPATDGVIEILTRLSVR